jgi:glycosyltransferase involved in cell wall biosynthesis
VSAPPRVLICARPATGGAARVLAALLRRLPERGIRGTAALSGIEGSALLQVAREHGWDTVQLDLRREISPVRDAHAGLKLRRLARGHDLVHAHAAKAGALARVALPLRKGVPVIYAPHGFYFTYHDEGSPGWRRYLGLEQRLAPRTTLLHCVSEAERDVAVEHGLATEEGCHVLPNPVPPPSDAATDGLPEPDPARPLVVMVARLAEPKDPVTFVRAAAACPHEGARFALVGDGPLRADVRAADPAGRVTVLPPDTPVRALFARASAAVLATASEALPLSLVEALAEGVPAVASDVPGCRAASGDAALYVPTGDPAELGAAVGRLLDDPDLHARLATEARARAPLFDEDRWADGLAAMYDKVLHRLASGS